MYHLLKSLVAGFVCLLPELLVAQQDTENYNVVELGEVQYKKEAVNMYVLPENGLLLTYDGSPGIPAFFQFSANSTASVPLMVQITVTDGEHVQTITREVPITENGAYYEVPIHPYLTASLAGNPNAGIKSISITNLSNSKVMVRETLFSASSVNYPVGINQVFVMDMISSAKRYYIHSNYSRPVTVNIYDSKGILLKKEKMTLESGNNFIGLEVLQGLRPDKYVIVVSDATNLNIASTMTVMF